MSTPDRKAKARGETRKLVREALTQGDQYHWNQALYRKAGRNPASIPWADMVPNPNLVAWLGRKSTLTRRLPGNRLPSPLEGEGKKALVVACGLGDDAEEMARRRYEVTAFDVSPEAIEWCRERFPDSRVSYAVADLFLPPTEWLGSFNLVVESYTLQTFPKELRPRAARALAELVAPGGTLFVIARGREPGDPEGEFPWPLTRVELDAFNDAGLAEFSFEDFTDKEDPPVRRFRVEYRK